MDGSTTEAGTFVAALRAARRPSELPMIEKRLGPGDEAIGVRMRDLFDLAKAASTMPLVEVEALFASPLYEVRMGAFCILDFRAKARSVSGAGIGIDEAERRRLYDLYLGHHDRITTWDMVDRAAPSVVGGYLMGRSADPLHALAASGDPLRRRTAITAPLWFIRHGSDLSEVFAVAALLADDPDPVVHKAVGIALKHAGARDPQTVATFLDAHGSAMQRIVLRAAVDKLEPEIRSRFLG